MSNAERISKRGQEIAEMERELASLTATERKVAQDRIEVKRRMLRCMMPTTKGSAAGSDVSCSSNSPSVAEK